MAWLAPAALVGLAAVLLPLAIHLLRRRTATHLVLPTTRFLVQRSSSTVRLRRISDPMLLLVRIAIVAAAALALAQPLWLGSARVSSWANRTARVVVVDTSDSARAGVPEEAVAAERTSADPTLTIESRDLGAALRRASRWLADAPPARREIVVFSDFQRGTLSDAEIAAVPAGIGLRFVSAATPGVPETPLVRTLVPEGVVEGRLFLEDARTAVTYAPDEGGIDGLRILAAAGDQDDVRALLRVVARAGAAAPDPSQPIIVRFRGGEALASVSRVDAGGWSYGAAQRLLRALEGVDVRLDVAADANALLVDVDTDPSTLVAARVVKEALDARPDPAALHELEPARIPPEQLAAWTRQPAPPDPSQWRKTDESDGRVFWALALVLLGVETLLRRSRDVQPKEVEAHAA